MVLGARLTVYLRLGSFIVSVVLIHLRKVLFGLNYLFTDLSYGVDIVVPPTRCFPHPASIQWSRLGIECSFMRYRKSKQASATAVVHYRAPKYTACKPFRSYQPACC